MAFIPFPNGAKAIIDVGLVASRWSNTLWFEHSSPVAQDYQDLADYLHTWYGSNVMSQLDDSFYMSGVTVYDMSAEVAPVYQSAGADVYGGIVGDAAMINAALVVTFYTLFRGRSGRGRNYVTGFSETDTSTNSVSNPVRVTNVETAYGLLIAGAPGASGFNWVVASQYEGGVPRLQVDPRPVTAVAVRSNLMGSQRRRIVRP